MYLYSERLYYKIIWPHLNIFDKTFCLPFFLVDYFIQCSVVFLEVYSVVFYKDVASPAMAVPLILLLLFY